MAEVRLRLAAMIGEAGRDYNEDNYQICTDLSASNWGFTTDSEIDLSDYGTLLVVCDGMGGANAGEVASQIAIDVIREWFSVENLSKEKLDYPAQIRSYIKKTVQAADCTIKQHSSSDPLTSGMGTTIVLAWFINRYVYVGWCGDSRCYRFNPTDGLKLLSHDHSYVQELVDKGKLCPELAFDFPDRNIITRSLGAPHQKATADVLDFPVHNGDVFLLCSDGLSGTLRDDELERIIRNNSESMTECRNALWSASEEAGWDDNVTLALCQILSGADVEHLTSTLKLDTKLDEMPASSDSTDSLGEAEKASEISDDKNFIEEGKVKRRNVKKSLILTLIIAVIAALIGYYLYFKEPKPEGSAKTEQPAPSGNEVVSQRPASPPSTVAIEQSAVNKPSEKSENTEISLKPAGKTNDKVHASDTAAQMSILDETSTEATSGDSVYIYNAKEGDSWMLIANRYNITPSELRTFNGIIENAPLKVGKKIKIPVKKKSNNNATIN
jgi:protein phosphatase